jgi:hypothetical protein
MARLRRIRPAGVQVVEVTELTTGNAIVSILDINSGNIASVSANGSISVSVTSIIAGTSATSLGKAEDAVAGNGNTGVFVLGVRNNTHAIPTSANGDYSQISVDDQGDVYVNTPIAHDAVDADNPFKIGGYASAAAPSNVSADGDRVNAWYLRNGAAANVLTAAGALIGGDAANGLDVDVTRLPGITGSLAHDAVNTGANNPLPQGVEAIAHGTNPTAVSAGDVTKLYGNRAGIPFFIGGHPNVVTLEAAYTAAQTDVAIVTVSSGLKIVVTECEVICSNANTVNVGVRVGFGATTTPTTTGVVLTHPGVAPGSGVVRGTGAGIIGVGADGEDLRITCTVPTTGSIRVLVTYYTIES